MDFQNHFKLIYSVTAVDNTVIHCSHRKDKQSCWSYIQQDFDKTHLEPIWSVNVSNL